MYEVQFPKLTEQFFSKKEWPTPDDVKNLITNGSGAEELSSQDRLFMILYTEIFYRHIHKVMLPTLAHRVFAWENYVDLFTQLSQLVLEEKSDVELPVQWVWDIVDEFLYQFQDWCSYTSNVPDLSDEEIDYLKENSSIWNTRIVLQYLGYLKTRSGIIPWLEKGGERGLVPDDEPALEVDGEVTGSASPTYRMLGYFCIIGELRLHCLFRDYHLALQSIAPIDLSDSGLFTNVMGCHVTLFQHMGISYFMSRRYTDAATTWASIISIIEKNSARDKSALSKMAKMYGMLAVALSLCPMQIDASVADKLHELHGEQMLSMSRGDESTYRELLQKSLPVNLSPSPPDYDEVDEDGVKRDQSKDATKAQTEMFLGEVKQHGPLPMIRSYLKLYSSVGIKKLSDFCRMDTEEFRTRLLALKHKSRMTTWKSGPAISGDDQQCGDVEFYIKDDVIHVSEPLMSRREARDTGDFFLRHIDRLQGIIDEPKRAMR